MLRCANISLWTAGKEWDQPQCFEFLCPLSIMTQSLPPREFLVLQLNKHLSLIRFNLRILVIWFARVESSSAEAKVIALSV
eukprot:scaffold378952_cov47-Prasinocladus_malaysianus.AAC.1